ncbi:MAG: hypothetical protein ACI9HK_001827 [Pirellulaceae bacterium]
MFDEFHAKLKNVRFGLGTIFFVTSVIAFTVAICRQPDSSQYSPKDIHPIGAFIFATIVITMFTYAIVELGKCLGFGDRSLLRRFRDRESNRTIENLDEDFRQRETVEKAGEEFKQSSTRGRRWWAAALPNRNRPIGHNQDSRGFCRISTK